MTSGTLEAGFALHLDKAAPIAAPRQRSGRVANLVGLSLVALACLAMIVILPMRVGFTSFAITLQVGLGLSVVWLVAHSYRKFF